MLAISPFNLTNDLTILRVFEMQNNNKKKITVIHGPNLNLLGSREPDIYGRETLDEINETLFKYAEEKNIELVIAQSNSEGALIDLLHEAHEDSFGVVMNPAAFSHTSIAIRDAIKAILPPVVEVHISNIHTREDFRSKSITAGACSGVVTGFGAYSYILGMKALLK